MCPNSRKATLTESDSLVAPEALPCSTGTMPRRRTKPEYVPGSPKDELHAAFDVFITDRLATGCAPDTMRFYRVNTLPFIDWLLEHNVTSPGQITAAHVQQFTIERHGSAKPSTRKVVNVSIRAWLRLCHERGIIPAVPAWKLPRVKDASFDRPFLSGEDVLRVMAATTCPRDRALVAVLVDSGIRRGEAAPLVWGDVDMDTGTLTIRHGKSGRVRSAFVSDTTVALLRSLRDGEPHAPGDRVFLDRSGHPLNVPALSRRLSRLGERAGVRLSSHRCRRTYATLSTLNGMGLAALQDTMGHVSQEQTKQYVRLLPNHLRQAHAAASPMGHLMG